MKFNTMHFGALSILLLSTFVEGRLAPSKTKSVHINVAFGSQEEHPGMQDEGNNVGSIHIGIDVTHESNEADHCDDSTEISSEVPASDQTKDVATTTTAAPEVPASDQTTDVATTTTAAAPTKLVGCPAVQFKNFEYLPLEDRSAFVPGGTDPFLGTTYICRFPHSNGDLLPGKLAFFDSKSLAVCFFPFEGGESYNTGGEALVYSSEDMKFSWIKGGGGVIPPFAVVGGRTKEGEPLYISKASVEVDGGKYDASMAGKKFNASMAGKVGENTPNDAYVTWGGTEFKVSDFSVLVCVSG